MYNFTDFKNSFYSRVKDLSLFDSTCGNLLKVVLDGLKVDYVSKFKVQPELFYPLPAFLIIQKIRYLRYKPQSNFSFASFKQRETLIFDVSGRYVRDAQNQAFSFYFHKIIAEIGVKNIIHFVRTLKTNDIGYDVKMSQTDYLKHAAPTRNELQLRKELIRVYKRIKLSGLFNAQELKNIQIAFSSFFTQRIYWRCVFDQLPDLKQVITIVHYHNEAMISMSKERGLRVYELQHGIISTKDIFYALPMAVSPIIDKAFFPDKIFVYGAYWKHILMKGGEYFHRENDIVVLGNYFYQTNLANLNEERTFNTFKESNKIILITTQTFMHEEFIEYILWLSNDLIKHNLPYKIVLKRHPSEKGELYDCFLKSKNVLICDFNLSFLFKNSDIHISIYSTTLFDALQYGLPNFSLASYHSEDYREEILQEKIALPLGKKENPVFLLEQSPKENFDYKYYFDDFEALKQSLTRTLNTP